MKSENKKIIIFGLALLILAGIIVVVLKGFNVSLDLRAHDKMRFVFGQKIEKDKIDKVCQDVFGKKEYEIKPVGLFSDTVYIVSPTITNEEKIKLAEKLNEIYPKKETKTTGENGEEILEEYYYFYSDAKVRLRDIVKPYIFPSVISAVIIVIYMSIRYRKLSFTTVLKTLGELLIVLLSVLSIIAILRIQVERILIPIIMFIEVAYLVLRFCSYEKELRNQE